MHELSVVANLFEILKEKLEAQNGKRVCVVKFQVGLLSGVVPELLKTAFDIYKKDTFAEGAELDIIEVPVKVECQECRAIAVKNDYIFICETQIIR